MPDLPESPWPPPLAPLPSPTSEPLHSPPLGFLLALGWLVSMLVKDFILICPVDLFKISASLYFYRSFFLIGISLLSFKKVVCHIFLLTNKVASVPFATTLLGLDGDMLFIVFVSIGIWISCLCLI